MPLLTLARLRKTYATPVGARHTVIDLPSLTLEPGQHIALRGESGTGKTTLLHLIAGILTPDTGTVHLDGLDMAALPEPARDRHRAATLGYIYQTFNLLQSHTCLENVELGMAFSPAGVDRAHATALLRQVGLADRLHHRPRQLSTGQQQRVAVARALANRPKLVLADEPTGNLDARNAREVIALIRRICRESGAALLLVTHSPEILSAFETTLDLATLQNPAPR